MVQAKKKVTMPNHSGSGWDVRHIAHRAATAEK